MFNVNNKNTRNSVNDVALVFLIGSLGYLAPDPGPHIRPSVPGPHKILTFLKGSIIKKNR